MLMIDTSEWKGFYVAAIKGRSWDSPQDVGILDAMHGTDGWLRRSERAARPAGHADDETRTMLLVDFSKWDDYYTHVTNGEDEDEIFMDAMRRVDAWVRDHLIEAEPVIYPPVVEDCYTKEGSGRRSVNCGFAGEFMRKYEDTDVTVTEGRTFDGGWVFDLSDGTHWFEDNNDRCQVVESLIAETIGWSERDGWVIVNEDGSVSQIEWL